MVADVTKFFTRLRRSAFAVLVTLTIALCTIWQGVLHPFGLASEPSGRRMTSTFVGEAAANGHRWGRIMAAIIDRIFLLLGDCPNHCARAYREYQNLDD